MRAVLNAIDRLIVWLAVVAGLYLTAIMFGIVFQATARTLGYSGSSHVFTFTEYGLLYIVMLGSPWLVRSRGHVYIELLTAAVSPRWRAVLSRCVTGLCVLVCLVLSWYAAEATWKAYLRGYALAGYAEMVTAGVNSAVFQSDGRPVRPVYVWQRDHAYR